MWGYKFYLKRIRIIEDLPTSSIKGVFIGLVEIKGTAETENIVHAKLTSSPCVAYSWKISEHWKHTVTENHTDSNGNTKNSSVEKSGWTVIEDGSVINPFYLKDETGVILINPEKAKLEMKQTYEYQCGQSDPQYYNFGHLGSVPYSTQTRCFYENSVSLHEKLYIIGQAKIRDDIVAAEIAYDALCPIFLISSKNEQQINISLRRGIWFLILCGFVVWIGTFLIWANKEGIEKSPQSYVMDYRTYLYTLSYFVIPLFVWLFQVFNSMVDIRNRTNRAWSLIDIELKRRADLLPKLFECVKNILGYENEIQKTLANLRSEISKADNSPPTSLGGQMHILAETYPDLKTSANFSALMRELSNTEDRIALARSYFNESATWQNTRFERIPEGWIARLAGISLVTIWNAEGFEHRQIDLALKS